MVCGTRRVLRAGRYGEKDGYSSPMRRASELPHITAIHQIGIRSFGSSRQDDIDAARNWGAHIHLARDICTHGIQQVIDSLPDGGQFFVNLDVDGLDPSVMPGTIALAPGGLDCQMDGWGTCWRDGWLKVSLAD